MLRIIEQKSVSGSESQGARSNVDAKRFDCSYGKDDTDPELADSRPR
jgi:hypothetical protein